MKSLTPANGDPETGHRRILRAHEILSSLSDANRRQFQEVIESLRAELADE